MVISDFKFAMSQPREGFFMTQAWLKMLTQTPLDRMRWASFPGRWIGQEPTPIGPQGPPPREHSGPQSTVNLIHRRTHCCTWQKGRALSQTKCPSREICSIFISWGVQPWIPGPQSSIAPFTLRAVTCHQAHKGSLTLFRQ